MIAALVWLVASSALTVVGPAALRRLGRRRFAGPHGMLALWLLATGAWLLSWSVLVVMLVSEVMGPGLKGVLIACITLIQALHRNGAELWVALLVAVSASLLLRFSWVALQRRRQAARWRRGHLRDLAASAEETTVQGYRVWLVDADRPDVYCLPGDRFGIVVTRGAIAALSPSEMRAVLAHERAHLHGRHHLMVAWVRLLDTAFPRVSLLRAAAGEVAVLVEWAADDQAARSAGAATLAHALGAMADSRAHATTTALAVSGACPLQRVRRLLTESADRPRLGQRQLLTVAAFAALAAPPMLMLAATLVSVATTQCSCSA